MSMEQARQMLEHVPEWELKEPAQGEPSSVPVLARRFRFKNFVEAMAFVNKVADVAEEEGHHPDIHISWNRVRIDLTTHAVHGLSDNDFIMAAKIDLLAPATPPK